MHFGPFRTGNPQAPDAQLCRDWTDKQRESGHGHVFKQDADKCKKQTSFCQSLMKALKKTVVRDKSISFV